MLDGSNGLPPIGSDEASSPSSPPRLRVVREIEPLNSISRRYDMNEILTAIALSIALPAVAHAQAAPAPAPKADCCEKMKAEGKECCCKDKAGKDHAGHDMSQSGAKSPQADPHQGHQGHAR
jgi:hypothetical protein